MKSLSKFCLIFFVTALLCVCIATMWYLIRAAPIGNGFVAKYLCSSTFISKRDPVVVFQEDVIPVNPLLKTIQWEINHEKSSVTASFFGLSHSRAVYRKGCGCTLFPGATKTPLNTQAFCKSGSEYTHLHHKTDIPWPDGSQGPINPEIFGINIKKLQTALDEAFAEPGADNPRKTRAILIVYDGRLIAERYAKGFNAHMPLLGWSMSKGITNALVGILVRKGIINIHDPAPVPEWQKQGDPRQRITLDHLLRMISGIKFEEVYDPLYDVTEMLYNSNDFAAYAARKPLETEPGTKWYYSSGTSNIVARIVRHAVEDHYEHYYTFIRKELFDKTGMFSALMEPDASGTFVGSSYTFATPRDWARFGLLYLQDGVWNGERILPEGWVTYTSTPTAHAPRGEYGAHFWLNAGAPTSPGNRLWSNAPRDTFAAQGFHEQRVIIIPSKKLVLVRFGTTVNVSDWNTDEFISNVLKAFP
jgi:CubicO group peptidase (beta-lactamase class C family)